MTNSSDNNSSTEQRRIHSVIMAQKLRWSKPNARANFGEKIRGFNVPDHLRLEYRRLRFKLGAKEAGKLLGLV